MTELPKSSPPPGIDAARFRRILSRGIAVPIVLMVLLALLLLLQVQALIVTTRRMAHSDAVIGQVHQCLLLLVDRETGVRGFLITGNEQFLEPYEAAGRTLASELQTLRDEVRSQPDQGEQLDRLQQFLEEWNAYARNVIALRRSGGAYGDPGQEHRGKALMDEMRRVVAHLVGAEEALRARRSRDAEAAGGIAFLFTISLTLLAGMLLSGFSRRDLSSLAGEYGNALAEKEEQRRVAADQRRWLQLTLSSIGDAVIATDVRGRVTFLNSAAARLCGCSVAEGTGKPLADVFRARDEATRRPLDLPLPDTTRVPAAGDGTGEALLAPLGDADERCVEYNAAPIRGDGGIQGQILVFRDITQRRAAGETQARLAAIVESSDDAIIGKTLDGIITSWNSGAVRTYGYSEEEIVGKPISTLCSEDRAHEIPYILDRIRRGERVTQYETVRVTREGRRIDVSITVSPIHEPGGRLVGAATIARDITESKRLRRELQMRAEEIELQNEELAVQNEELEVADRQKNEFLAMLAHELRNPLAPMMTGVQLARAHPDPDRARRALDVMERQVRHMARLVDDLLDASRLTHGKIALRRETVDVSALLEQALQICQPLLDERRHCAELSLPGSPLQVQADPVRLVQVFSNLVNNAARYTDPGGRISVSAAQEGPEAVVRVRDSGSGIAPELLPRVFDLFVQGDRPLARSEGGLGIGLTLVRNLVEQHGGRVEAHSEGEGRGSEFVVRLPSLLPPHEHSHGAAEPRSRRRSEPAKRVLVVEDNHDAAATLAELLELWGCDVAVTHSGEDALGVAKRFRPDTVLLDIGLPGQTGHQVAGRLRAEPELSDALLVALTGYGQEEDRRRSRDAGIDLHLVKPIDPTELHALLRGVEPA